MQNLMIRKSSSGSCLTLNYTRILWKTACQTEAAHVVIPQEYDQWQEIEGLKKQVLNGEIVVMDCFLDHLGELCRTLEKSVNFTSKELQSASKLRDEKRDI